MSIHPELPADRRERARKALAPHLGKLSDHRRLDVSCRRNHHVAGVYAAGDDLVYAAVLTGHGHGSRDFVDVAHSASPGGTAYLDFLDLGRDTELEDKLPASCECGQHTLSRAALLTALRRAQPRLIVD